MAIHDDIAALKAEILATNPNTPEQVEAFRLAFVAKSGRVNALFTQFKDVAPEERKAVGALLNELKDLATDKWKAAQEAYTQTGPKVQRPQDLTLPAVPNQLGSRHPLSITRAQILTIFQRIGFVVEDGPEVENDYYNFGALNFADNHPARDMQDTFFVEGNQLLRTHTSSVQIRLMERQPPPIRALMPGRVYRNEAISARAHCQFHQIEGLFIDKGVSFADLKDTLNYFVTELFGSQTKTRFRASYFPFTEPSTEVDISCLICGGEGCNVCKHTGWVEILGAGMVHPNVLRNVGIDPEVYSGFAFGMGVERITMLLHGIKDLRLFTENDLRFVRQFQGLI